MMYDCEVRVLLFIGFFFYHGALLETLVQFSAFSAQEAGYRVSGFKGLKEGCLRFAGRKETQFRA